MSKGKIQNASSKGNTYSTTQILQSTHVGWLNLKAHNQGRSLIIGKKSKIDLKWWPWVLFHSIDINFQETKRYLQWAHLKNPFIRLYSFKLLWYSIQVTIVKIHNLMHGRTQSSKLIVLIAKQARIASSSNSLHLAVSCTNQTQMYQYAPCSWHYPLYNGSVSPCLQHVDVNKIGLLKEERCTG